MNYKLRDTFLEDGFYVTQNYMARPEYYKQFNLLGHEGVDFGHTDKKRQIRSPLTGTVFISFDKNYGNYAVVEDYKQQCAVYLCHLENVVVVSGEEVTAGDPIGEMGQSGNSTGEHCHCNFLILKDGSNKYRAAKWNWGYLDLLYPRDTGSTVKLDGVEDYSITWGSGTTPENTQLTECEIHKNNLQEQVNGLLKDLETQKGVISDTETKLGTANGRIQELTKQNDNLSSELGAVRGELNSAIQKIDTQNKVISSYVGEDAVQLETLKRLERENYDTKTLLGGLLSHFAQELKVSLGSESQEDAISKVIDAFDAFYSSSSSANDKIKALETEVKKLNTYKKPIDKLSQKELILELLKRLLKRS